MATKFNYEQWEQYLKIADFEETVDSLDNILFTAVMRLLHGYGRTGGTRPDRCVECTFSAGKPSQVHQTIIQKKIPDTAKSDAGDFHF